MDKISVAIVDDNKDIRSALERIIQTTEGYIMAGSYPDAEEALENIPLTKPNIVLMDINLGGESGIECVRKLKSRYPEILFLMCTIYEEDEIIFEAFKAGANGYILKKTAPGKLLDALREVYEGGAPMSSQIARKVADSMQTKKIDSSRKKHIAILTKRENEVLELLAKGILYKEIGMRLFISHKTVRNHVNHIYEKLHVNNRTEAINKLYDRYIPEQNNSPISSADKTYNLSVEQIQQLSMLSISILDYINHDLGGQNAAIFFSLNTIKEELKKSSQNDNSNKIINDCINDALEATKTIASINSMIKSNSYLISRNRGTDVTRLFVSRPYEIAQAIVERNNLIEIKIDTPSYSLEIVYPPAILFSILSELTENARKTTSTNLTILFKWYIKGHNYHCEVHDNGPGFDGLSYTFVPRTSLKQKTSKNSRGMGLKIIERTIMDSGGHIFFSNSDTLGGAKVCFEFPVFDFKN